MGNKKKMRVSIEHGEASWEWTGWGDSLFPDMNHKMKTNYFYDTANTMPCNISRSTYLKRHRITKAALRDSRDRLCPTV